MQFQCAIASASPQLVGFLFRERMKNPAESRLQDLSLISHVAGSQVPKQHLAFSLRQSLFVILQSKMHCAFVESVLFLMKSFKFQHASCKCERNKQMFCI